MTLPGLFDVFGLIGAVLYVAAFAGLQLERLDPRKPPALLMNLFGAVLVTISLLHAFNLASVVLQVVWGGMALYGLIKHMTLRPRG